MAVTSETECDHVGIDRTTAVVVDLNALQGGAMRVGRGIDVFISYSRADEPIAAALATNLEMLGLRVWYDKNIGVGEAYRATIAAVLQRAHCVAVVWSPTSTRSPWVLDEAAQAREHFKLISLVVPKTAAPASFRQLQAIDLPAGAPGVDYSSAAGEIDAFCRAIRAGSLERVVSRSRGELTIDSDKYWRLTAGRAAWWSLFIEVALLGGGALLMRDMLLYPAKPQPRVFLATETAQSCRPDHAAPNCADVAWGPILLDLLLALGAVAAGLTLALLLGRLLLGDRRLERRRAPESFFNGRLVSVLTWLLTISVVALAGVMVLAAYGAPNASPQTFYFQAGGLWLMLLGFVTAIGTLLSGITLRLWSALRGPLGRSS
jgi:hypothetical protein